jgi:hypothetical protein
MAIHRFVVAPWVEPVQVEISRFTPTMGEETSGAWWQDYFVEGSWQRNSPKVLETPRGILVFKNWEQLSDTRWRISPLTILIPQGDSSGTATGNGTSESTAGHVPARRAIFVENPQGAEIQFREAIDLTSGKPPPPVVGGQLNGPIRIYAPPRASGEDELLIDTRDLRIDRKMISTTQAVTMKIGRSRIEGRDLSIHLDNSLLATGDKPGPKEEAPFEGLDFLELIYVDRVDIDLPPGGMFGNSQTDELERANMTARAEVLCDNAFRFDFHRSQATLSGNVRLRHMVTGLPEDIFQSETLNLHFKWQGEWSIDTIEAMGANGVAVDDPTRWVRLEAPSLKARGQGRWFKLDMNQGRVAIANHLPAIPATDSAQVYLQQDSMQVWSPEIEYESEMLKGDRIRKSNQNVDTSSVVGSDAKASQPPTRLGKLWSAGPGQALLAAEGGDQWRLSWAESLQLQPEGEYDRLSVVGSANARSETQGRFSAEKLDVLLASLSPEIVEELAANQPGNKPNSVVPKWLHATGKTIIHSPQLRAQVSDIQVWFSYPDIEAVEGLLKDESPQGRTARLARNQPIRRAAVASSQPAQTAASPIGTALSGLAGVARSVGGDGLQMTPNNNSANNLAASRGPSVGESSLGNPIPMPGRFAVNQTAALPELPMNVTGDTLIAKVSNSQLGTVIEDLLLSGMVTVTRDQVSSDSAMPLTITGNELRIDTSDGGQLDATVSGTPAKLAIGDAALSGPEVRFNQRSQTVWIDKPGVFRLPVSAMRDMSSSKGAPSVASNGLGRFASTATSPAPQLLPGVGTPNRESWIEPPEVAWNGRMVFDGRVARMDGGVQITGRVQTDIDTIWHLMGNASEMRVELKAPVRLAASTTPEDGTSQSGNAEVNRISLMDRVDIKAAQTDSRGNRRSIEHLQVPELVFIVPEERFVSTGPGEVRSRRIAESNQNAATSEPFGTGRNASSASQISLQCVHLAFQGRMEGFIGKQQVTFYDRVEAILGDILTWESGLDVHKVDQLALGNTRMYCDELSIYNESSLTYNQAALRQNGQSNQTSWVVKGNGQVSVDSHNEKGHVSIQAQAVSYAGLYSKLSLEGSPGSPARVRQYDPRNITGNSQIETSISSGWINLKTGESQLGISRVTGDLESIQKGLNKQSPSAPNNTLVPSARDSYPLRGRN